MRDLTRAMPKVCARYARVAVHMRQDEGDTLVRCRMSNTLELLTAEEVAQRLRIQPETVRTWARQGLIPAIRLSPKVVRYDLAAVVNAMTTRQEEKKAPGILSRPASLRDSGEEVH